LSTIAEWLTAIGMSEYAARFAENRIDISVLRGLNDEDLKELGVMLGDRRKMMRAILELAGDAPAISHAQAWAALPASSVAGRFDAMRTSSLTALVGRGEESETLLRLWSLAKTGTGQVVLLTGEAGIGKSRLAAALMERLALEPHGRLHYFCSPQHTDSPLYPIINQLERGAGLAHDDRPQAKLEKLDAALALVPTPPEYAALFAAMLSLPNDGRYPVLELTPQQRRQKTLDALAARIETLAAETPILMIAEDVHWIDPTSLEVLDRVIDRIDTHRVLLIITFRPEFEPPWVDRAHVTVQTLDRLAKREVGELIDSVVGSASLPAGIRQDIAKRADGIPLFVEEMTKAVMEAESEGAAQRAVAALPPPSLAVPASLHASLMARLDRLGPAKEVAQIGAAIGREFSHALLTAVMGKKDRELNSALDRLILAGLLFRQGTPPQATYLFKHALVQDAAYGTLLREPRRQLHARIADALESQFSELAGTQPELVAHHCTQAGLIEKAALLWGKAGQQSMTRSALLEAKTQLGRALTQIETLPGSPTLRGKQIRLQVAFANVMMHIKGYAAPESQAAFEAARALHERAEALGEPPEDPLLLFSVLAGVWAASHVAFNGDVCCDLAARFLALAEKQKSPIPRMIGHRLMGSSLIIVGEIAASLEHYNQAMALYDPTLHRSLATRLAVDIGVVVLSFRSQALWILGYPDAALADVEHALKDAREIGQATTLMFALYIAQLACVFCRDHAAAVAHGRELAALTEEKGALLWKAFGMMNQVSASAMGGQAAEAIEALPQALLAFHATGATLLTPFYLISSARAYAELGRFDDAWGSIDDAMQAMDAAKERWCEAELHRTAGEIALMLPQPDAARAEQCFERALTVAPAQEAKAWELRAVMSMARLWRDQGNAQQALDLLGPVYGWFTEGFDTLDLKDAKALLDILRNTRSVRSSARP
jgi:predicted ATPase